MLNFNELHARRSQKQADRKKYQTNLMIRHVILFLARCKKNYPDKGKCLADSTLQKTLFVFVRKGYLIPSTTLDDHFPKIWPRVQTLMYHDVRHYAND